MKTLNAFMFACCYCNAFIREMIVNATTRICIAALTLEMFQPRGEEGEEKEVTIWRLRKFLRMQDNKLRPDFRKPADMPMSGPSTLLTVF